MKILYLSRWFPSPIDNGAKTRLFHLIKGLAEFHTVDFNILLRPAARHLIHSTSGDHLPAD